MVTAGRAAFIGREPELARLRGAFDAAAAGDGSLVLVVGEPGAGKTALCGRLAADIGARGGRVLVGHCYEEGSRSLPYLPFVEALRAHALTQSPDALAAELGAGAADVARIVPELRERLPVGEAPAAADPEEARYRLFQAVTAFLRAIATARPLALILEDLHDADRGTLDLLVHVARALRAPLAPEPAAPARARVLVVGTYRDVEVDRAHPLSAALAELRRAAPVERVALRGLTPAEVGSLVDRAVGPDAPAGLAAAVHDQTEGNPLFVQEVLRWLVEEGAAGRAATPARDLGLPEGLRDVIGRRLSRLGPECNRVLGVAAVVGREFELAVLEAVAGVPEEVLLAALEEAVRAAVLEERAVPGGVEYRFAHALFRRTLYEELIAARRIRLHQQVARALEARYAARPDEHAAELAEHFGHSSDPADLARAVAHGEAAARRAMAVSAYGEAARLLERAAQVQEVLDPDDRARRCDLLLALGEALLPAGEPGRVVEAVAPEALRLAEALADRPRASRACQLALEALTRSGGTVAEGGPAYGRWAERAGHYAAPDSTARVLADSALAIHLAQTGRPDAAWALHQRALGLARRLGDPEALLGAAWPAITHTSSLRHGEEIIGLARELSAYPRDGVGARTLAHFLTTAAREHLNWGDRARAEALEREVADLAARTRDASLTLRPLVWAITVATLDGRLDEAVDGGARLAARAAALGVPDSGALHATTFTLRALLYLGRADALAALADAPPSFGGLPTSALCLAQLGRHAEARAALRRFIAERGLDRDGGEIFAAWLALLLETAVLAGDREAAAILAPPLARVGAMSCAHSAQTCPARHLGGAAALLGDRPAARRHYTRALEVAGRIRFRPELALTRLQLAELLAEGSAQERGEARAHLASAVGELEAMRMQPALARARRLHERLDGVAPTAPKQPDGLSERELEVLRLVAAGKSNPEIAEALVISLNTVYRHVNHIFTKLGVENRVEAATYAHQRGLV